MEQLFLLAIACWTGLVMYVLFWLLPNAEGMSEGQMIAAGILTILIAFFVPSLLMSILVP